jgi:hypothetical protein
MVCLLCGGEGKSRRFAAPVWMAGPHARRRIAAPNQGPIRAQKWVVSQHLHADSATDLRGEAPDLAPAHDANRFAVQVEANPSIEREIRARG